MHTLNFDTTAMADSIIQWLNQVLPRVPGVVLSILVGILAVRLTTRFVRWVLRYTAIQKGLRQIIASAIETLLWILLTIQVLGLLGFGNIIVFFSSSALALGILLAAGGSTLLSDLIAGIFLARDGDFNVGDEVEAGENHIRGVIEHMDVRRVRLRDADGLLHVLPNSVVERKEWVVIHRRAELSALAKATKVVKSRIATAAREKVVAKGKLSLRKNAQ